jgi:uncharacterized membrane protein
MVTAGRPVATATDANAWSWVWLAVRVGLAAVVVGFFIWQSFYDHAADFKSFYSAGYAVRDRSVPLYDLVALDENPFGEVFKLPPSAAVYLVPVSYGTVQQARLAWRLLLVAAFVAAYTILARWLRIEAFGPLWLVGFFAWALFGPLQIAVGEGQWDPIFLLLIAVSTVGVAGRRPLLAAIPIAVAASIKPYPIILAGFFLARHWWRALALTMLALALLSLTGAAIVGADQTLVFVTRMLPASGATTANADNQSFGGVIARLVTDDLKPFPLQNHAVDLVIRAVALLAVALTVWLAARSGTSGSESRALQLGLFVPVSVLVVPAAWSHYQTILLVPLTLLAIGQLRTRPRGYVGWALLAVVYLLLMLPNPSMLYGSEIERNLWLRSKADSANLALQHLYPDAVHRLVLSYKVLGAALLYGLTAWRLRERQPRIVDGDIARLPEAPGAA